MGSRGVMDSASRNDGLNGAPPSQRGGIWKGEVVETPLLYACDVLMAIWKKNALYCWEGGREGGRMPEVENQKYCLKSSQSTIRMSFSLCPPSLPPPSLLCGQEGGREGGREGGWKRRGGRRKEGQSVIRAQCVCVV
ncbi:hypothetical protein Naga_101425g1 [Nannochloropsis gaditana]|uniref:Uncharacterized protein n=1 Tax=Nannochloropsis gaditana TaxID=72520 RepID=W7TIB8_9STRA|nr:hypothetical protein Naga_101425g1 [Nannochloropsis gaditana]